MFKSILLLLSSHGDTIIGIFFYIGFSRNARSAKQDAGDDCSSKPDTGPCRGMFPKFYFDASDKTCKEFTYGGCDGNGNRYDNKDACMKACGGQFL